MEKRHFHARDMRERSGGLMKTKCLRFVHWRFVTHLWHRVTCKRCVRLMRADA